MLSESTRLQFGCSAASAHSASYGFPSKRPKAKAYGTLLGCVSETSDAVAVVADECEFDRIDTLARSDQNTLLRRAFLLRLVSHKAPVDVTVIWLRRGFRRV
ncbi:hypothetical protein HGRIS_012158 [Hohenbuehelia grisea]|uniref:Uncharacterized protein n=1 Tax=Hohenbuehelia grisea TaxID=104357 RepID=A0ABR3IRF1_9AGAR